NAKSQESFALAMDILDAGFRNGGQVTKMIPNGGGKWTKETFHVFAPYVMTGINKTSLSDTAVDRSFAVEMKRKPQAVKKKSYSYGKCERECEKVRGLYYHWALANADVVTIIYHSHALDSYIQSLHLNDRAADIWKPIFAIAQAVGIERTH